MRKTAKDKKRHIRARLFALRSAARRRAIVLLLVVTMLVLLALLATTYLLVTGSFERGMEQHARTRQKVEDPKDLLDQGLYAVVRDTQNPNSAIRGHGLLTDMYGGDQVLTTLAGPATLTPTGQFLDFLIPQISPREHEYNGCVVTFLNGPMQGTSGRCVRYFFDTSRSSWAMHIMLPLPDGPITSFPQAGNSILINGRPFNGTGVGYNPNTGQCDTLFDPSMPASPANPPVALLPNTLRNGLMVNYLFGLPTASGSRVGAPDESYDAADLNNVFLAAVGLNTSDESLVTSILPSYHRPALVGYMNANYGPVPLNQYILRPLKTDHPNFTGSNDRLEAYINDQINNQGATLIQAIKNALSNPSVGIDIDSNGSIDVQNTFWDVDNDGDGIADSIWIDIGSPPKAGKNGRLHKVLYAIHCVDLDGRLNVNAHGTAYHVNAIDPPVQGAFLGGGSPRGQGYGPPEISLKAVLNDAQYQQLLFGGSGYWGRYGSNGVPGLPGWDASAQFKFFEHPDYYDAPSATNTFGRGFGRLDDLRGDSRQGLNIWGQAMFEAWPPPGTVPVPNADNTRSDTPYEIDLRLGAPRGFQNGLAKDEPFSLAELEAILRARDVDTAVLAPRLRTVAPALNTDLNRRIFTTDSYDLPVPSAHPTSDIQQLANVSDDKRKAARNLMDLVEARMIEAAAQAGVTAPTPAQVNSAIAQMLPTDLRLGLMMDVNRPFGNAVDENDASGSHPINDVVDEHGVPFYDPNLTSRLEGATRDFVFDLDISNTSNNGSGFVRIRTFSPHALFVSAPIQITGHSVPAYNVAATATGVVSATVFDTNIPFTMPGSGGLLWRGIMWHVDGTPGVTDNRMARQLYARHLYVLMMLLADQRPATTWPPEWDTDGSGNVDLVERARGVAQWAINAVDFRDADSIMTPFEYDVNPFDAYDSNGDGNVDSFGWDTVAAEGDLRTWRDQAGMFVPAGSGTSRAANDQVQVVWGCERPELLISETLAWHDRRTEDTDEEMPNMKKTDDILMPDMHFDQKQRPRGRLFIELYNPWGQLPDPAGRVPQELYSGTANVQLGSVAPARPGDTTGAPVWRIIVPTPAAGPNDPDDLVNPLANADVERGIYFRPATGLTAGQGHGQAKYVPLPGVAGINAVVQPGRYAVAGSAGMRFGGSPPTKFYSVIGRSTDPSITPPSLQDDGANETETQKVRAIMLEPGGNPQVQVRNNFQDGTNPNDATPLPAIAIPMVDESDNSLSLSLTEPGGGYPDPAGTWNGTEYAPPYDLPFDLGTNLMANDGTIPAYRTIHLQRLANPLIPFDPVYNPYRTLDSVTVDVHAFNGLSDNAADNQEEMFGGLDLNLDNSTHERGEQPSATGNRVLWSHEKDTMLNPMPDSDANGEQDARPGDQHYFPYVLSHSLGYLNTAYGNMAPAPNLGAPAAGPFPWLTWNNRPFVGPHEMMLVPWTSSYELPRQFTLSDKDRNPATPLDDFSSTYEQTFGAYGHLLNWFYAPDGSAPQFHRVFDYLRVPSRFVGADSYFNPALFATAANGDGFGFRPPGNRVSNFRDPGRININTVYSKRVWDGLFGVGTGGNHFGTASDSTPGPSYDHWILSRTGYTGAATSFPTYFVNPLRTTGDAQLVPLSTMVRPEVECTLLRSDSVIPPVGNATRSPRFEVQRGASDVNSNRNPYFRNLELQRLGNLVTCRSNVYAIWITVGYFEVDPATYQLGAELGSETGEVTRHRGFYIVDRSIPVGFEPGQNHNVDRAVLVRRVIE